MKPKRRADRTMLTGGGIFIAIGLSMLFEGIVHTISGTPIPATTWTQESSGPEQVVFGLIGIALGGVAIWLAFRKPPGG
jgi:hypothetical protein